MGGSRKFCQGGTNLIIFSLVDEGRKDPNTTIIWPLSACQQNTICMAFNRRADDGPTLNVGLVAL